MKLILIGKHYEIQDCLFGKLQVCCFNNHFIDYCSLFVFVDYKKDWGCTTIPGLSFSISKTL